MFGALAILWTLFASTSYAAAAQSYYWDNLAGAPGGVGSVDGSGSNARFYSPGGIAVDGSGNMYVADTWNDTIRKITPGGAVTTLAGSAGNYGSADGSGTNARFGRPGGVAVDGNGNLYVADTYNNLIRKVTPDGTVTTFAGYTDGSGGTADGWGTSARFFNPTGVAVDSGGNVYVADSGNNTIRKITPGGLVTTLAGNPGVCGAADGVRAAAQFNYPSGVAVDASGNVYVADTYNYTIRKVTPSGAVTTIAGHAGDSGSADGTRASAQFQSPQGVAVDASGNVYVADSGNNTIREVTPGGVVTTLAGNSAGYGSDDGSKTDAQFDWPSGVAVDASGNVYVADTYNNSIRKSDQGGTVITVAGNAGGAGNNDGSGTDARFYSPSGVAVDSGDNVYVADAWNNTIRKVTPSGVVTTLAGDPNKLPGSADGAGADARFYYPASVAADSSGNVYVADTYNHTIRKITAAGVVTTLAGAAGLAGSADGTGSKARFNLPGGIAVDGGGNVIVADTYNSTIRRVSPSGVVTTIAGTPRSSGYDNGYAARFDHPYGVAVDSSGNIYVADTYNGTIRFIPPAGNVSTLAGTPGSTGSADGEGSDAAFNYPYGVAADSAGNVYVADTGNNTIRKITSAGNVTTIGGQGGTGSSMDGFGGAALFSFPGAIAVDTGGNLYVADMDNNRIAMGTRLATGQVPTITGAATEVQTDGASLAGKIFPNGLNTQYYFRYGTTSGYAMTTGTQSAEAGQNAVDVSMTLTGLQPSTTYHFEIVAINSSGTSYGVDKTFTTAATPVSYFWSGFAGTPGGIGDADGTGPAARFNSPNGVAVDGSGNLYVADTGNNTIRKIAPDGAVATIAGLSNNFGFNDGPPEYARFSAPKGIAVDRYGNVYIADSGNNMIRKISLGGVVSTLAGGTSAGSTDGVGSDAAFNNPTGIAVDSALYVYVADTGNDTIRKVAPWGTVTTVAGAAGAHGSADGKRTKARFRMPTAVTVDGRGDIYVADSGNDTIRKITTAGVVTTVAGKAGAAGTINGPAKSARFHSPGGVALDHSGNLYVTDAENDTIRKIARNGSVSTFAGKARSAGSANGAEGLARFSHPGGVAVDGHGNLYVADVYNSTIRRVASNRVVTTQAGSPGNGGSGDGAGFGAQFHCPYGAAVDASGNVYVADTQNDVVRKITPAGVSTTLAGRAGVAGSANGWGASARFNAPAGVAVDAAGNVYVADSANHTVRILAPSGYVATVAGKPGVAGTTNGTGGNARFHSPTGVAVDAVGNVFVADSGNHTIRIITPSRYVGTLAGTPGVAGEGDGPQGNARFCLPRGVAVDPVGNVYVADSGNSTIRKIDPSGSVTTLAGWSGVAGNVDGTGSQALFRWPTGVAVDASGNVYVADAGADTIRMVTAGGAVSTIGGQAGIASWADGTGSSALFSNPTGIAATPSGTLYVADQDNNRISKGSR